MPAYSSSRYAYEGTETVETSITRVGGAVDPTGQAQSRKIVTSPNSQWLAPFRAEPYAVWNPTSGANVDVTVYGIANAGALPNNDDIWLEVEYLTLNSAPPSNTTLNPNDKESHITLSGGNLTATGTAGWTGFARAVDAKSSGKFYWETTFNATQNISGVGVAIGSLPVSSDFFTTVTPGHCGLIRNGLVYVDSNSSLTVGGTPGSGVNFGTIASGTVICIAIDITAKLIWWRLGATGNWNNSAGYDPATGAGGVSIPNVGTTYPTDCFGGADTLISNFGSSAFTGAVPSGFTSGWPVANVPAPLGVIVTTTKSNVLAAGAAVASDASTWNVPATVYDPARIMNSVSLSNGNLTVTQTAAVSSGVCVSAFLSGGKYYFEATASVMGSAASSIGILLSSGTVTDGSGSTTNVICIAGTVSCLIYANGVNTGKNLGAASNGDVFGFAIDLTNHLIWIRRNNGNWNADVAANPATGTNGIAFTPGAYAPYVSYAFTSSANVVTGNFGATSYANAAPSGFANWITGWIPFKFTATLGAVYQTWDAATAASVTLSGGNLVATNTGMTSTNQGAHVDFAKAQTSGKYYFEFTITTFVAGAGVGVGIGTTAAVFSGMSTLATGGTMCFVVGHTGNGTIFSDPSGNIGWSLGPCATGDVICVAADLTNRKVWFRKGASGNWDGISGHDPTNPISAGGVIIISGAMVPFVTFGSGPAGQAGQSGNVITANFGASAFVGAVPSGYTAGWPTTGSLQPGLAGYLEARVRAAKPSTTFYIDPTITLTPAGGGTSNVATAYKSARYIYEGAETTETSITRVGGAADPTGQAQSRKIVTSVNAQWLFPYKAEPYAIWNPNTGANVTVTMYGTINAGALPNNDDIWLEVEYLTLSPLIVGSTVVWDPGTISNVTLSGGNLVATNTTGGSNLCGARVPGAFKSSGKYYFETTITAMVGGSGNGVGIALSTVTYDQMSTAATGYNMIRFAAGALYTNGTSGPSLGTRAAGDVIGMAVDLDNRQMWFRVAPSGNWNGSGTANPATNTGGMAIPAGAMSPICNFGGGGSAANNVTTVNFGASAFTGSVPSGFTAGWFYPDTPAAQLGTIVTTTKANVLAANAAVASDSSTWNNSAPTFDPTTTVNANLSNSNLTATHSNAVPNSGARCINAIGSGKYYFEMKMTSPTSSDVVGLCAPANTYNQVLSSNPTVIILASNGNINVFSSFVINIGGIAQNDVVGIAVDFTAGLVWIRRNAGNWNGSGTANPATGTGGFSFTAGTALMPVVAFGTAGSESWTANFGGTSYANAAPAGFGNWVSYTPFRLVATLSSPQPGLAGYIHVRPRAAKPSMTFYLDPQVTLS